MDKTPRVSKASVAMNWREMIQDGLVTMKTIVEIRYAGRKQHPGGNTFWGSGWRKFRPLSRKLRSTLTLPSRKVPRKVSPRGCWFFRSLYTFLGYGHIPRKFKSPDMKRRFKTLGNVQEKWVPRTNCQHVLLRRKSLLNR